MHYVTQTAGAMVRSRNEEQQMTKYRATFANGFVATRQSHRVYSHAWRVIGAGNSGRFANFAGSAELARKASSRFAAVEIVEVEIVPSKSKPAATA
jgi:hypothetical protein